MATNTDAPVGTASGWKLLPHDADVRVFGWGPTCEIAFEQAALALKAVVTEAEVNPDVAVEVTCEAADLELLFVEWLNVIIFEMAVREMIFCDFAVSIENHRLTGTLLGESANQMRHEPACEPKGATYTALGVVCDEDGKWSATCVVDV